MSATRANCPACSGEITFSVGSSIVVICPHCKSAIARTDRKLEDLGKVAALAETSAPFAIGQRGAFQGVSFLLTGRAQIKHFAGGAWDEWYIAFNDGRWGWLAEAHGEFYLTFEHPPMKLPSIEDLSPDQVVPGLPGHFVVAEKGSGVYTGAEGEIPFRYAPGYSFNFADLNGDNGAFGTIDYRGDPPCLYSGRGVTLAELGFRRLDPLAPGMPEKRVGVARIGCPNCGGSLELHAPDQTERVACPYCGALLDATKGALKFLSALKPGEYKPLLPLGAKVEFEKQPFTVIGFVVRSCIVDGTKYFWREYLLYGAPLGFRWLVHSDQHWTYVKSIPAGAATERNRAAVYDGKTYKRFQDAKGVVEYVSGEFYWKVSVGEAVDMTDWVNAPKMISRERSEGESNWSIGEYVTLAEMRQKFPSIQFPAPITVGACQPFAYNGFGKIWAAFLAIALFLIIFNRVTLKERDVLSHPVSFAPVQNTEATQTFFSEPLEIEANKNLQITASAPVNNSWISLDGDLINDETGLVQTFDIPIEYYSGVEDGESWSEGSQTASVFLSALPAGKYTLRLEAQWKDFNQPAHVGITIKQGVARVLNECLLLLAISIVPIVVLIWRGSFEARRWNESMYNPYKSSSDDD